MRVFIASHVFPVASPLLRDGAVAVDGERIVAVGPREQVLDQTGDAAERCDLGNAALLPGLVNAHSHVELSWMKDDPPPGGDYITWVHGFLDRRAREDVEQATRAAESAIQRIVARGTVALGDVANGTWVLPLLARSSLHGVAFHEVFSPLAADAERLIADAIGRMERIAENEDLRGAAERWKVVLTPHAPHTTSEPLLRALAGRSAAANEPLSIHVAESEAEVAMLNDGSGPLPQLLRDRGLWDDGWHAPGHTPVEYLDRLGVLSARSLIVHGVRLLHGDHSRLQTRRAPVVTCPRSNEWIGVGTAPIPELLGEGVPVALGTDSLASSPDLDLFAEMAALCRVHPRIAPAAVLRMATLNGATALGLDDRLGSIEPGKLARLVVVPLEDDQDPLQQICSVPAKVYPLDAAPLVEADA